MNSYMYLQTRDIQKENTKKAKYTDKHLHVFKTRDVHYTNIQT